MKRVKRYHRHKNVDDMPLVAIIWTDAAHTDFDGAPADAPDVPTACNITYGLLLETAKDHYKLVTEESPDDGSVR